MSDLVIIVALTVASCAVVGGLGLGALHLIRRRRLADQLAIATLLPVLTVVAAVIINVRLMFISEHDSIVISVALVVSLLLAGVASLLIRRRLTRTSRLLGEGLDRLVADSARPAGRATEAASPAEAPREFAAVLHELDLTRSKLADARTRQHASDQARRELISFMSHDLRTPLAGLRAVAEGLEDGVIDDVPQALAHVRQTVARMTVLVDDLFALSRVSEPQIARPRALVSLTELLSDVVVSAEVTAAARGVTVTATLPQADRLAVFGSGDDLARALTNLAANAIRHTDSGSVRLEAARAEDGHVRIAVVDGCGGIPDDHLPRVFDTGWRGTPARGDDGGAGLGLAIARGVVEAHAGAISVRNVDGGCRFEVTLPAPTDAP